MLAWRVARRRPGTSDAVLVKSVVAFVVGTTAVAAWRTDGATTISVALAGAALVAVGLFAASVYCRVRGR